MKHLIAVLLATFVRFGGPGLLVLGILDPSFLFAPLGNDLLVVALTAQERNAGRMSYYAAMSAIGSVGGCALVDMLLRRAGESGLARYLSPRRMAYVKTKVDQNAAIALVLASIAPPPFPFTPFVMATAALQYPRRKMFAIVGAARMVRFTALGVLAAVGSAISVAGWIRRSRKRGA